jgi:ferredoxin
MRVEVQADHCEGHGRCYALAPELFAPDDIGNSEVIGDGRVDPTLESKARLAFENCPERAVLLVEP